MPNATPGSVVAFADVVPEPVVSAPGLWSRLRTRLRRDPFLLAAVVFLAVIALIALLAPILAPYDPTAQFDITRLRTQPPSREHWFGTDPFSRDVLSRVIDGARVSLTVAFLAVLLASLLGTTYGAIAGFRGGALDTVMMRALDACIAIPRILLLLAVVALWGTLSAGTLVVVLGLTGWFSVGRLVRAEVLAVKERDFVAAARVAGSTSRRMLVRHVIPHVLAPVLVAATLGVANIIVVEAGLSFLGYGIPQPRASWGSIIRDGKDVIASAWWLSLFPGLALASTVLAVNVVADRLREALNPRQLHGE